MNPHTQIAYAYLYGFRRTIPPLAAIGSIVAWLLGWEALAAGLVCVAIGELLESSYYINVLRWADHATPGQRIVRSKGPTNACLP
jgi:hypothetical protein